MHSNGDVTESDSDIPPVKRRRVNGGRRRYRAKRSKHSDIDTDIDDFASDHDTDALSLSLPQSHSVPPLPLLTETAYASIIEADIVRFIERDTSQPHSHSPLASLPPPVRSAIRQLSFRRFIQSSLFVSDIDAPYYLPYEFIECGRNVGVIDNESAVSATSDWLAELPLILPLRLWRSVRRALGKPRRLSPAFFASERAKLDSCRAWVRLNQRGNKSLAPPSFIDTRLPWLKHRLVVGESVFVVHPITAEIHSGVIIGYDDTPSQSHSQSQLQSVASIFQSEEKFHRYKVKFVDSRLGTQIVDDVHCMRQSLSHTPQSYYTNTESNNDNGGVNDSMSMTVGHNNSADLSRAMASVLQLLDRKHALIQQLDRMNSVADSIVNTIATISVTVAGNNSKVSELCASFQRNYAWVVIQLEATSKSLEGALMTARLHRPHRLIPAPAPALASTGTANSDIGVGSIIDHDSDRPSLLTECITVAKSILFSSLQSFTNTEWVTHYELLLLSLVASAYIVTNTKSLLTKYTIGEMVDSVNMLMHIVYQSFLQQGAPARLLGQVTEIGGQLLALIQARTMT